MRGRKRLLDIKSKVGFDPIGQTRRVIEPSEPGGWMFAWRQLLEVYGHAQGADQFSPLEVNQEQDTDGGDGIHANSANGVN